MLKYDEENEAFKIRNYQGSGIYIKCERSMILRNNSFFYFCSNLIKVNIISNEDNQSQIILKVIHGFEKDKQYNFFSNNKSIIQIGRKKNINYDIDIEFNEDNVSKIQTKIFYSNNNWNIIDGDGSEKKSRSGTWVLADEYTITWDGCIIFVENNTFEIQYKHY